MRKLIVIAIATAILGLCVLFLGGEANADPRTSCYNCRPCTPVNPCLIGGEPHYGEACQRTGVPGARGGWGCREAEDSLVPHTLECEVLGPGCCSVACPIGVDCDAE